MAKRMVVIKGKKGQKPLKFHKGGLHETTGTPQGQPIPHSKMMKAKAGGYGALGAKQARFALGALAKGRRTANK